MSFLSSLVPHNLAAQLEPLEFSNFINDSEAHVSYIHIQRIREGMQNLHIILCVLSSIIVIINGTW